MSLEQAEREVARQTRIRNGGAATEILSRVLGENRRGGSQSYEATRTGRVVQIACPATTLEDGILPYLLPRQIGSLAELQVQDAPGRLRVSSPYGHLPSVVLSGLNGELFTVYNYYLFTLDGDGIKYQQIKRVPHNITEHKPISFPNLQPRESDSRLLELTPEDMEVVHGVVEQLKAGELVRIQPKPQS